MDHPLSSVLGGIMWKMALLERSKQALSQGGQYALGCCPGTLGAWFSLQVIFSARFLLLGQG